MPVRTSGDLARFRSRVEGLVHHHPVVVDNAYTRWFATGEASREDVRHLTVQFSVFSHLFVEAQLRKVINAPDLASYRAGKEILLTQREYLLLEALATREGQVLTREMIQERVWRDDESYSNTVDVHISALRKKIDVDQDVRLIHTVHGRGYMLKGPDSEEVE